MMRLFVSLLAIIIAAAVLYRASQNNGGDQATGPHDPVPPQGALTLSTLPVTNGSRPLADEQVTAEISEPRIRCSDPKYLSADALAMSGEDRRQRLAEIANRLVASSDAEHILMAGLLGSVDSRFDLALLRKALEMRPDDGRFHWHMLQVCSRMSAAGCETRALEEAAVAAGGRNGALWAQVAVGRVQRNNEEGALTALRNAVSLPEFDSYFIDDVLSFERGLAAATGLSYGERIEAAIVLAVGLHSGGSQMSRVCQSRAEIPGEWRAQCLQFGQRLERDGRTLINVLTGLDLQKSIFEISHDMTNEVFAERRGVAYREVARMAASDDVSVVLHYDERVMAEFIREWAAHGELAAARYAREETDRLMSLPDYDPCAATPAL